VQHREYIWRFLHQGGVESSPIKRKYLLPSILLFVSLLLIFPTAFDCSWHFDDYDNIVANASIQITDLFLAKILKGACTDYDAKRWQRPLSYSVLPSITILATLCLRLSRRQFFVHFLTGSFLIFCYLSYPEASLIRDRYEKGALIPSLCCRPSSGRFNPVHVSAVTYIVQRMAQYMVALFYVMNIVLLSKGDGTPEWNPVEADSVFCSLRFFPVY